jgi:hypothetical protein
VVAATTLILHKQVLVKASVLAWRLLCSRLPTRDNIIAPNAHFCVTDCGSVETAQHVFLSCPVFPLLWGLIRSWVVIFSADPLSI